MKDENKAGCCEKCRPYATCYDVNCPCHAYPKAAHETRGSFSTPVNFEMVYKTIWAWLTDQNLIHKNIIIEPPNR